MRQWFHLAPDLSLLWTGDGYVVYGSESDQPLRISALLDGPRPSLPILAREQEPMQGWWSPKERELIPAYAFCYEAFGVSSGAAATLFTFSEELTPERTKSRVNVSGRTARLQWRTEIGLHEVKLNRPQHGDMTLEYSVR